MNKMPFFIMLYLLLSVNLNAQEAKKKIFNGKNLKGWVIPDHNIWWHGTEGILSVKNGPDKKGSILWTKESYRDFVMQLDFRFGDGTIDSGVFIRDEKLQIQIGESGSLKRDLTASPYVPGKGYPVEAKNVVDLLKMKGWNAMKILARGPHTTVWLNGTQVMEYESAGAALEGPIGLQLHGNRDMAIDFRNVRVSKLK